MFVPISINDFIKSYKETNPKENAGKADNSEDCEIDNVYF